MDVRQFAFLAGQPSASLKKRDHCLGLPKRGIAFLLANVMFWQPLWAQADGIVVSAPGTTLGQAGNGVPIVNIAAPNGSGLSHNQFQDYNVGSNGVILNNATGRTQSTQLGGIILGNSNLNGRAASTILNEVNGGSPSQLRGYTEVAGQSAHVIVANPYGITCNGCGFINTPQATLTTGKPVIENGEVSRYQVDKGSVSIEGAGLNANNLDRFEIITRSAKLNAEIQAKNLTLVAGANDVDAKTLQATARAADPASAPQLAIDSSALGGMYAGAIKLVGTEAGVGVKLDGKMVASGGDIQLDANGHLSLVDTAATGAVNIKAQSLEAKGPVYAGTTLDVKTAGDLTSQNNLVAKDRITVNSGGQLTNNGIIEAGVNADNSRNTEGDVEVTAQNFSNSGKSVIASRDLKVTATQTLGNQGGTLSGQRQTTVTAGTLDNQNRGRVLSSDSLILTADTALNGQGGLINSVGQLTATLGHLNNNAGEVSSKASSTLTLGTMDNLTGLVMAENTLGLTATGTINNQNGVLSGWQGLTVTGTRLDNRNSGTVSSRSGDVGVTLSGALLNSQAGAVVSQKTLTVKADSLDNSDQGVLSSGVAQQLTVAGLLDNTLGGAITSSAALTLQAMALNNGGTISADDALSFTGTDLDNSHGTFTGNAGVTLDLLGTLTNHYGKLSSAGPLRVQRSAQINNQHGGINSQGLLTLLTGSLDNSQQGTIGANDTLLITASGHVDNSADGLIASRNADLQLNADSLANAKGSLQGKGAVTLSVTGDIDNQSGKVIAQDGDLTITAANLDSRGGLLSSVKGAFESHIIGVLKNGYDLTNNQGGTIQAQRLALNAFGGIDNNGGRIAAQAGDAVLDARSGNIDNRNGGLYASNLVQVSGTDLDNSGDQGGKISASEISFSLLGKLNNRQGIIESGSTLSTTAASLDNQNGQLRSLGRSLKTLFAIGGLLDNSNGTLETANTDLGLDAGSFRNQGGSLLHVGTGIFGLSMANLEDVGGRLVTHGDLTLDGDSWTNSTSIQAEHLTVNVNRLTQTASGQLLSTSGLKGRGIDWRNDGLFGTDGALDIDLSGHYSGKGRLSSLGTLDFHAAQADLQSTASIAGGGDTTINLDALLNNAGRVTSSNNLKLTAAGVTNTGTLGSGKDLLVTTGALVNDQGLISSGGDLQLLASRFTNSYAQVYSLGTALIARDGAGTQADLLDNRSGDIESLGKLTIAATTVNNVMDVLEYTEHEKSATGITRLSCTLIPVAGCDDRGGGRINGLWELAETDRLNVTRSTAAASLTSGADLQIDTQTLNNTSSLIAATGNVQVNASTINNKGLQPQEIKTTRRYWSFVNETGAAAGAAATFNARNNPTPSASYGSDLSAFFRWATVDLGGTSVTTNISDKSYDAIIQAGGNVTLDADNKISNSVIRPFYEYVAAGRTAADTGTGNGFSTAVYINAQLPPDLAQQQINPVALPGFSLPTGQNGLFRLSGQGSTAQAANPPHVPGLPDTSGRSSPQKYLIETNPVLTDLKQFMSSDYLLSNLGYDPDTSAKRLGDGFYEQKLIQQAVTARTGQRFIDGQTSDDAMFKYLMNNAIASKQQLNLQLGVTLTSEQVAALTHDIVWMENQTINGEQVLVPVLYLANANNRLADNGALIQGADVSLIAGKDLENAGTLRASNNLKATANNDLVNSGLLEAGNRLDALASNNLSNKAGGIIAGRDVSVTAVTGDVRNERTVTTHQSHDGLISHRKDFADSAARIEAGNALAVTAGRDIRNSGSVLQATGDAQLQAGGDLAIISTEQVSQSNSLLKKGSWSQSQTVQNASQVQVGGSLTAKAGQDVNVVASSIVANQQLALSAERDVFIASAANESHAALQTKKLTSSTDQVRQQSSVIQAGGDLSIQAGQDLTLVASQVKGTQNVALDANRDISVLSAKDESASFFFKKSKGSFGRSQSEQRESYDSTNVASVVEAGKDLTINASKGTDGAMNINGGRDVTIIGSKLKAHDDLMVAAQGDVTVLSGVEEHGSYSKKTKSGFLGLSKSSKSQLKTTASQVGSELDAGNDVVVAAGNDIRLRASEATAGNDVELHAGVVNKDGDINLVSANDTAYSRSEQYKKKTGLSVSGGFISFSSAKEAGREAQSSTSVGSQVVADRDASLQAERDINISGSGVKAGRNVALNAGRDVNVVAAQNNTAQVDWQKKKQSGIGFSGDDNGISAFFGTETKTKQNRNEQQTAAASQIDAGENLTVNAKRDINQSGSDLKAFNDIELNAGRNINIDAAREVRITEEQRLAERNGATVTVNHNLGKTRDAIAGVGKGDDAVSQVSSVLKAADAISQFLLGSTQEGKTGHSQQGSGERVTEETGRASTLQAGNDIKLTANNDVSVKGSQFNAGRDINVSGRDVSFDVAREGTTQESTQRESWVGVRGGTSGGFKAGFGGSYGTAAQDSSRDASGASQLDAGRDINLKASNDLTLIGTQAQAGRNINLDAANDLNIRSAQNSSTSTSTRSSGGAEGGITVGSEGVGGYVSVNIGKGNLEREGVNQQEAYLYAGDRLSFTSGKDTNVAGANLRGNEVVGRVGGDLNVASVADTGKAKGKEFDVSATVAFGPGSGVSGSVGYGETTGKTNWVEEQTRITAKDKLDIRTENHTQINGAVIASDSGNLKLDTGTLGFSDIAGQDREHGYYLNVGGTYSNGSAGGTPQDASQVGKGKEGQSGWSISGWNSEKDREQIVRATVGSGEIVVRDDKVTGHDSTLGLNRDVNESYSVTRDYQHRTDLYVSDSSVDALLHPAGTYESWSSNVKNFKEIQQASVNRFIRGLSALWGEIQAQRVDISDVPANAREALGDERALAIAKNLVRRGIDPSIVGSLNDELVKSLGRFADLAADYDSEIKSCSLSGGCDVPPIENYTPKPGEYLIGETVVTEKQMTIGKAALDEVQFALKLAQKLPVEQIQATAIAIQAMMGPMKFVLSVAVNQLAQVAYGDKKEELTESASIKLAAKLIDEDETDLKEQHAAAKQKYAEGAEGAVFNGNGYVVASRFLIDSILGEVQSLGIKAGKRVISVVGGKSGSSISGGGGKPDKSPESPEKNNFPDKPPVLREVEIDSGAKGGWSKALNKPEPNTIYKVDGNKVYQTDNLGRVEKVEADLTAMVKDRNKYQQCKAGKCGEEGDEGGHLIASILGGPGEKLNLVPMDGNLNKGVWKVMENVWSDAAKAGKSVNVKIEPIYSGGGVRPDRFNVSYRIDGGRPVIVDFKNSPGGI
ncbi:hemagglutinin repeat-containing protein [Pseudomonas sp. RHF3.3-3]|uniref:hemagglutinin repeat-containing protein n=1 Tax=Pseudomonas sp. RHF3.3-3 TaxID=3396624 RepID=UPI003A8B359D